LRYLKLDRTLLVTYFICGSISLAACGGSDGQDPLFAGTNASGSQAIATTDALPIALGNLPASSTRERAASITYTTASAGTVYCRLDVYTPIPCPNPFVLGATSDQALAPGTHTVDYYLDAGAGFDLTKPTASYSWVVAATTAAPAAPSTGSTTATNTTAPTGSSPMAYASTNGARIEAPSDSDSEGFGTKALTNSAASVVPLSMLQTITRGGVTRFGPTTVDGRSVIEHRIVQGDPRRNGGNRSELSYSGFKFANGEDLWFASAFKFGGDCDPATSGGASDRMLIQQTHQDATSVMANPFSLTYVGGGASQGLNWVVAYEGNDQELYRTPIQLNQWIRTITHYRSGFTASGDAPIMEVWVAYGSGAFTKLSPVSAGGANQQFGDPLSTRGSGNDWPKIGLYKWTSGSWGSSNSRTVYSSGLYAGKGANLFNEAAAALSAAGF